VTAFRALVKETHKLLQDSEAYAAYAAKIVRRYRRNDMIAKWTVAAAACVPFMAKLNATSAPTASWFAALVPLLAIGLPLLNFSRVIQLASELHGKHAEILPQLKKIWREMSSADEYAPAVAIQTEQWKKEIHDIDVRLAAIRAKKSEMPEMKSLMQEAARDCDKVQDIVFHDPPALAPASATVSRESDKTAKSEQKKEPPPEPSRSSSSYSSGPTVVNYTSIPKL
jgi:hypothetical protein